MEFDLEDDYKVEHGEDFILTDEQFKKLIEAKFERNNQLSRLVQQSKRQLID